jgi:hypothetical protein
MQYDHYSTNQGDNTMKLTKAQIETLNNAEQNSSKPGRVWMPTWNDNTIRILNNAGLIEYKLDLTPDEIRVEEQAISRYLDEAKAAAEARIYSQVRSIAQLMAAAAYSIEHKAWFITEAGRQVLITANRGA